MALKKFGSLQKIEVTCTTCGVTESFFSHLSVEEFKRAHKGHQLVVPDEGDDPHLAPRPLVPEVATVPEAEDTEDRVFPAVSAPAVQDNSVDRVVVDSLVFPALPRPVLRVRGFRGDEEVFAITVSPDGRSKVREILEKGVYENFDGSTYTWRPEAVEYAGDVDKAFGPLPRDLVRTEPVEEAPGRVAEPVPAQEADPTLTPIGDQEPAIEPRFEMDVDEEAAMPSLVEDAVEPERVEPPAPVEETVVEQPRPREDKDEMVIVEEAEAPADEEEYLLVSKSWYVQGSNENRQEAVAISKVLREFRLKVQPQYTIGVMVDDILSIEGSKDEIGRDLIFRIEDSGYRLTSVTVEQGKPVAWFKKAHPAPTTAPPNEGEPAPAG